VKHVPLSKVCVVTKGWNGQIGSTAVQSVDVI
jgi:hypothetical protein